ncbi:MAG: hypothetical protein MHPSP_004256, partial [Paramarteilia canceri]
KYDYVHRLIDFSLVLTLMTCQWYDGDYDAKCLSRSHKIKTPLFIIRHFITRYLTTHHSSDGHFMTITYNQGYEFLQQ